MCGKYRRRSTERRRFFYSKLIPPRARNRRRREFRADLAYYTTTPVRHSHANPRSINQRRLIGGRMNVNTNEQHGPPPGLHIQNSLKSTFAIIRSTRTGKKRVTPTTPVLIEKRCLESLRKPILWSLTNRQRYVAAKKNVYQKLFER